MNMPLYISLAIALFLGGSIAAHSVSADSKSEHAAMKKEHEQAHAEHDKLLKQVARWKIEHRRALAMLANIQAAILEHEAELEELSEHAREHEDHILHHEEEITTHEKSGDDKDHTKLAESHKRLVEEHAKLLKTARNFNDDHEELVSALKKLTEGLSKKK